MAESHVSAHLKAMTLLCLDLSVGNSSEEEDPFSPLLSMPGCWWANSRGGNSTWRCNPVERKKKQTKHNKTKNVAGEVTCHRWNLILFFSYIYIDWMCFCVFVAKDSWHAHPCSEKPLLPRELWGMQRPVAEQGAENNDS